jgi:hypothetical protein
MTMAQRGPAPPGVVATALDLRKDSHTSTGRIGDVELARFLLCDRHVVNSMAPCQVRVTIDLGQRHRRLPARKDGALRPSSVSPPPML